MNHTIESLPLERAVTADGTEFHYVTAGQGYPIDNAGWCDFIINVTVASSTAVAGNILMKVDYLV